MEDLPDDQEATISDPQNEQIDVTVSGAQSEIEGLSADDITATIDGSSLEEGEQTVQIDVSGPQNIELTPSQEEATITVQSADNATSEEEEDTNTDTQTQ
nr:CdaR family protein [Terribacillus saccharophilus]